MVKYQDPISGIEIVVKSVCYPTRTLLQGKEYKRTNTILDKQVPQPVKARYAPAKK